MQTLDANQKAALAENLRDYFPFKADVDKALKALEDKVYTKVNSGRRIDFSISQWIRGMAITRGLAPLPRTNAEQDKNYFEQMNASAFTAEQVRDLATNATPGSYLVPTIQANEIVEMLADYGVLRRAGVRIVPMVGIEKLNMPTALSSPTVEWVGQNTAQSASDANLGQVAFALKTMRSLTPIPNELLATSVPAIDMIINELLALGFGEAEDEAFFSTTTVSNGPASLYAGKSALTVIHSGGNSANGGALTYADLLATMSAARKAKAKGPFVWFCNPHTLYDSISGLIDKNSRPIFDANQVVQKLFGWPIFDTTHLSENVTVGSTTLTSFAVFTNPRYIMIAEPGTLEIAVSTEFYFDKNQIAIRGVRRMDFQVGPPKGVTIIDGIV